MFKLVKESIIALKASFLLQVPLTPLMHCPNLRKDPILIKTTAGSLPRGPTTQTTHPSCVINPLSRGNGWSDPYQYGFQKMILVPINKGEHC